MSFKIKMHDINFLRIFCFCFRSSVDRFNFWEQRQNYADVIVVCGKNGEKEEVKSHKIILASASPFFQKEFEASNIVFLPDIDKGEFEKILKFLYRGEVTIEAEDYPRFIEVASQLSVDPLRSYFEPLSPKSDENNGRDGVERGPEVAKKKNESEEQGLGSDKKRGLDGEERGPESKKQKVQQDGSGTSEGIAIELIKKCYVCKTGIIRLLLMINKYALRSRG